MSGSFCDAKSGTICHVAFACLYASMTMMAGATIRLVWGFVCRKEAVSNWSLTMVGLLVHVIYPERQKGLIPPTHHHRQKNPAFQPPASRRPAPPPGFSHSPIFSSQLVISFRSLNIHLWGFPSGAWGQSTIYIALFSGQIYTHTNWRGSSEACSFKSNYQQVAPFFNVTHDDAGPSSQPVSDGGCRTSSSPETTSLRASRNSNSSPGGLDCVQLPQHRSRYRLCSPNCRPLQPVVSPIHQRLLSWLSRNAHIPSFVTTAPGQFRRRRLYRGDYRTPAGDWRTRRRSSSESC